MSEKMKSGRMDDDEEKNGGRDKIMVGSCKWQNNVGEIV